MNGIGWGHRNNGVVEPVGPCITGIIDNHDQPDLEQGMVIEEGSIPGALADYLPQSMLAGPTWAVRSVVSLQIATHVVCPPMTRLKSSLHLPTLLDKLGVESLTAYTDTNANWSRRLYDRFLDAFPDDKEEEHQRGLP